MTTSKLYVQNFYEPTLSSASVASSWDVTFTLSTTPSYTKWYITFSPSNAAQREIMFFDDVVGSTVYVKSENRWLWGTTAKAHTQGETVAMKDVAEIFNFFSNNISNAFYVEKKGWLNVNVWGWSVFYNQGYQSFSDTALTLTASTTNYIQYDYPTNTISASLVDWPKTKAVVVTGLTSITSITYQVAKESYVDFVVSLNTALPTQTGNAWLSLITDGTNASWWTNNNLRTWRWSSKILWTDISGNETEYSKWTSSQYLRWDLTLATITNPWDVQETQYESIISQYDLVWQTPDWIYKIQTEVKTSTALGWANTMLWVCSVSAWIYVLMYIVGWNATAVVASLSTSDAMTYWTPVNLWACASWSGWVALIDTNKVVFTFMDWSSTTSHTATSIVWTISGTTISLWSGLNTTHTSWGANVSTIQSVFKVRWTAYWYAVSMRSWDANGAILQVNSVSWTTITLWTTTNYWTFWTHITATYLADNTIALANNAESNNSSVKIYSINSVGTAITTTYTWTWVAGSTPSWYVARYSSTEFVYTNSANTAVKIYTIPWAWTVLVETTITANAAANYIATQLYDWIFAMNTGTTLVVKQRDVVIWTITWTPAYNNGISYINWRLVYFTWATLIPTIVNLAKIFMIGVASSATWMFVVGKNLATKAFITRKWYTYYLQSDGSLSTTIWATNTTTQTIPYAKSVLIDRLMLLI